METTKKTVMLIICGPSGVGKDSLINYLKQKYPAVFTIFVSATTRAPREGEEYGKDYFFLSQEQFKQWVKEGRFIEHEEVWPGIFYGSVKISEDILDSGKISISDIDIAGAISIKKFYGEQACVMFLTPPEPAEEELVKRLHGRGKDCEETIKGRVAKARKEIALAKDGYEKKLVDYIFTSDNERVFYNDVCDVVDKLISK